MAAGTRVRPVVGLDIYDDHRHFDNGSFRSSTSSHPVFNELPLANIQNIGKPCKPAVDALIEELDNFHITPNKENWFDEYHQPRAREHRTRPHVEFDTFQALPTHHEEESSYENRKSSGGSAATSQKTQVDLNIVDALEVALRDIPSNAEQLAKHQAGQWEWVLELPAADKSDAAQDGEPLHDNSHEDTRSPHEGERRLLFGCNLLRRKAPERNGKGKEIEATNRYTILATRVEESEPVTAREAEAAEDMSMISTTQADTTIIRMASPHPEIAGERRTSEIALSAKNDDIVEQLRVLPPARPVSRIEDSVEALDKFEEQLEAINEVTRLERVLSPEEMKGVAAQQKANTTLKRTSSTVKKSGASTVRARSTVERSSSLRKSASMSFSQDEEKPTSAGIKAPRKSLVTRPASLLPPKPPAKSSKPPTVPTFQLHGEVVAQRLKAQREARLSRQITPEQAAMAAAAYSPSKPHVKSTKPPTRPTFELPGDAISRRKREEREAKLRQQQEEERKRREFKARPVRTSMVATAYIPRETIASRARQSKAADGEVTVVTPRATVNKRHSIAVAPTPRTTTGTVRGRSQLTVDSVAGTSRATSTSTGSIHGGEGAGSVISVSKRSTVSSEEQQNQKARGREIFARDNSLAAERERERREKEMATKLARKEAAERSRQLSREWAEKQRMKRMSLTGSSA
ncbi:hypothetical protein OQA88_12123 [Cercophora sp. LCS_1]